MNKFPLPTGLDKEGSRKFVLILSIGFYLSAIVDFFHPHVNFDGRWGWAFRLLVEGLGEKGPAIFYFLLGTIGFILSLKKNQ